MSIRNPIETEREQQARVEVGSTVVSSALARVMIAVFLGTVAFVPIHQNQAERGDRWFGQSLQMTSFLPDTVGDGAVNALAENMERYEDDLESSSQIRRALLPMANRMFARVRNDVNEQMYLGAEGWMFYRPAVEHILKPGFLRPTVARARTRSESVEADPVAAILEFRERLGELGIELLVVPVPGKPEVYPEQFDGRSVHRAVGVRNSSMRPFIEQLREQHVHVVDPFQELMESKESSLEPLYLATDSHWSPDGMRVASTVVSDYIRDHELLPESETIPFRFSDQMTFRGSGDLERMLGQDGDRQFFMELRRRQRTVVARSITPHKLFYPSGVAWAEDPTAPVLVLGDSFSRVFSDPELGWGRGMGFVEQLSHDLGVPFDSVRINDQGAYATRQALSREAQSENGRLDHVKLVIWQFATRELSFGDWRTGYEYQQTTNSGAGDSKEEPARVTQGTILNITRPPDPGTTAYPDGLISVHLSELSWNTPAQEDPEEIIVFMWGMRDHQHTEAARYGRGQHLTLELQRWSQMRGRLGSFSRQDFDDLNLLRLPSFFGEATRAGPIETQSTVPAVKEPIELGARFDAESELALRMRQSVTESELQFMEALGARTRTDNPGTSRIVGRDGWSLDKAIANSILSGTFWSPAEEKWHARLVEPNALDTIVRYNDALSDRGIELIILPVPPKVFFHSDELLGFDQATEFDASVRFDRKYVEFYEMLRARGVEVMDVYDDMHRETRNGVPSQYLKDDHHWSGYGYQTVSMRILERLKDYPFVAEPSGRSYITVMDEREETGIRREQKDKPDLDLRAREVQADGQRVTIQPSPESPVLIIGDSLAAGLLEYATEQLGRPIDLVAVNAGGANGARIELTLRDGGVDNKRVVIWCFRARELAHVQSGEGWKEVPLPLSSPGR